ncbi:MAG: LuxR C-terminal-related transcriptional regulator [Pseudonocardia sp.]
MIALQDCGIEARKIPVGRLTEFAAQPRGSSTGVVVLDLNLGVDSNGQPQKGYDWIGRLLEKGWHVLTVTGSHLKGDFAFAIAEGAAGVVSKTSPLDVLLKAVMLTARGESLISEAERREWQGRHRIRQDRQQQLDSLLGRLTAREREVLEQIAQGKHAADIAKQSVVALTTVRNQIRSILHKLELSSQIEAIALLRQQRDKT